MEAFVWRAVDPSGEALLAALSRLPTVRDDPGFTIQEVLSLAASQKEGYRHSEEGTSYDYPDALEPAVALAWWTDALGRRHWGIVTVMEDGGPFPSFDRRRELARDGSHPLALIYPERQGAWRERRGRREWLVRCGCGECGTLAELAWMGECCGPCFDRHLDEGIPPRGPFRPASHPGSPLVFSGDGKLVALPSERGNLAAWAPPWAEDRLVWRTAFSSLVGFAQCWSLASAHGKVAIDVFGAAVGVFDVGDGSSLVEFQRDESNWSNCQLRFAGDDGRLLLRLKLLSDDNAVALEARDWRTDALVYRMTTRAAHLAVTPDGAQFLLADYPNVTVHDAATGRRSRTLRVGECSWLAAEPDARGRVFAIACRPPGFMDEVVRWDATSKAEPPGLFRRLALAVGLGVEEAPASSRASGRHLRGPVALSPDGRLFAASCGGGGVALFDAESLDEVAFVRPDADVFAVAFSPDGGTLAIAGERISLWPLRHLVPT